jgi:hypothetical protein
METQKPIAPGTPGIENNNTATVLPDGRVIDFDVSFKNVDDWLHDLREQETKREAA